MARDVQYWDSYYSGNRTDISEPSGFAQFAMEQIQADGSHIGKKLIDLGCGNGRDSMYFCKSGLMVTAVDSSKSAIKSIDERQMPIFAVCNDFVNTRALTCVDYDYCYARWSIHAITQAQQDELIPNVYRGLKDGGLLFIEVRTVSDAKYGQGEPLGEHEYFFDDHYRRFIVPDRLVAQLDDEGFCIVSCEQSDTFSVVGGDSPTLLRLVARKS